MEKIKEIVIDNKPVIVIPSDTKPDYRELRERMVNYTESKIVDDVEEVRAIIAEQKVVDPRTLEEKLFPRL